MAMIKSRNVIVEAAMLSFFLSKAMGDPATAVKISSSLSCGIFGDTMCAAEQNALKCVRFIRLMRFASLSTCSCLETYQSFALLIFIQLSASAACQDVCL
jgi:hypothetical protein